MGCRNHASAEALTSDSSPWNHRTLAKGLWRQRQRTPTEDNEKCMIQAARPEAETSTKHCGTFDYENQRKPFARGVLRSFPCRILVRLAENRNFDVKKQGKEIFWHQRLPIEPLQSPWICQVNVLGGACIGGDEPQFSSSLYSLCMVLVCGNMNI